MTRSRCPALWPFAMLAALAGCGSNVDETQKMQTYLLIAQAATGTAPKQPASGTSGLTRAILAEVGRPADMVEITGVGAVIFQVGTNRGVETWSSVDNRSVSFRQGMLVATRGLGGDLMAAETPPLSQVAGASGTFVRSFVYLNGEDQPLELRFLCDYATVGSEDLVIVERRYSTRRVQETCSGDSGRFVNDHWFQGGTLRQSRQWAGPFLEYVSYFRLRD
jgi:hypothetical protein